MIKRSPEIVILSDIHLGTYGCHAKELLEYLKEVKPKVLILNGDIIDMWQFKKNYFPEHHFSVVRKILKMAHNGTKVYYLTGNHDDMLRKFGEMEFGPVQLRNKLVFRVDGKDHWVFHGDVFDASIHSARWLAKLGGQGYDMLIRINRVVNRVRGWIGMPPASFSAKVKKKVKGAVKVIGDFEQTAIDHAGEKGYDYVICGHIHQPQIREAEAANGAKVTYMNSGDWIEHLTALEYEHGAWSIFKYEEDGLTSVNPKLQVKEKTGTIYMLRADEVIPQEISHLAAFDL